MNNLLRDALELLIVVAIGGTVVSALQRLRRGEVTVNTCDTCNRPTSRAYPKCQRCGTTRAGAA